MPSTQFSRKLKHEEIVAMLMHVSEIAKPISPRRAAALALELSRMDMTREEIEQGCKRYAVSIASQFREIQLSDFTNDTITSEYELRKEVEKLRQQRLALDEERRRFDEAVKEQVESRLSTIYIELSKIASCFPERQVIASRAIESVLAIIRDEQKKALDELVNRLKQKVMEELEVNLRSRLASALSKLDEAEASGKGAGDL